MFEFYIVFRKYFREFFSWSSCSVKFWDFRVCRRNCFCVYIYVLLCYSSFGRVGFWDGDSVVR